MSTYGQLLVNFQFRIRIVSAIEVEALSLLVVRDPGEEISDKNIESCLQLKRRLYRF